MFRKLSAMLLAMALTLSMFSACAPQPTNTATNATSEPAAAPTEAPAEETEDTETAEATEAPAPADQVTITWATWENEYVAREMARKFTERHPEIKIELVKSGWFAEKELTEWSATGALPDVFELANPDIPVKNGWLADLKPFIDKYPDIKAYDNLVQTGTIDGKVVFFPTYLFMFGVIVNKDLLAENNIEIPGYDWTIEDVKNIAIATTKGQTIGLNDVDVMQKHIPPQMNPALGWGSWDGEKYVLDDSWIQAVNFCKDLYDKKVGLYNQLDKMPNPWDLPEGKERDDASAVRMEWLKQNYGVEDAADLFLKGGVAMQMEFTWGMNFDKSNPEKYSGWDFDFYPFPVVQKGGAVSRPGLVCDSYSMSSACKNQDAAFTFMKYLACDPEGFQDRIDLCEAYDKDEAAAAYPELKPEAFPETVDFNHIPTVNDPAVRQQWADFNKVKPGVKYMMDNLQNGYVDAFKFVPAFDDAYHKLVQKTVVEQIYTGKKTAADLANELATKATEISQKALNAMLNK